MKKHLKRLYIFFLAYLSMALMPLQLSAQTNPVDINNLNTQAKEYIELGKYRDAEIILLQLDSIHCINSDTLSSGYATILNDLGYINMRKGKYDKSGSFYQRALDICSKVYGKNSLPFAQTLLNQAELYTDMQQFDGVEEKLETALNITETQMGRNNPLYADILCQLGIYYTFSGHVEKAYSFLEESAKIVSNTVGENHRKYAKIMMIFGTYYLFSQNYELSEQYFSKAKNIFQSEENKTHPDYLDCLFAKTTVDGILGNLIQAETALLEGMELTKKYFGEEHPHYAGALSNLASIYLRRDNFIKAEQALKESLHISNILLGKRHSYYFNALNLLAIVYYNMGKHELAEPLFLESLELRKELYGNDNESVFIAMNNLADFYISLNNYSKAEKLVDDAFILLESSGKSESYEYALLITQKAYLYEVKNRNNEALVLYEKAAEIFKNTLGENHPDYLVMLGNIVDTKSLLFQSQNPKKIEQLWLDVLSSLKNASGENFSNYILTINNLAMHYSYNGNEQKAHILLEENIDKIKKSTGIHNKLYHTTLWNLAMCEETIGNPVKAQSYFEDFFRLKREQVQRYFTFLSEKEREMFLTSFREKLNNYYASSYNRRNGSSSYAGFVFDCELFSKSLLLNSSRHLKQSIDNSNDEELIKNWFELKSIKNILIEMEEQPGESQIEKDELEDLANVLEKKILAKAKEYNKTQKDYNLTWQDIQKSLSGDEAVVEFINFELQYEDIKKPNDTVYSAIILCPEWENPEIIELCLGRDLRVALQQSGYDFSKLYPLIWKPLEKYLKGKEDIYIAPSGLLHQVPFVCLKRDKYKVHNILSAKDIPGLKEKTPHYIPLPKAVLFGGVYYGQASDELPGTVPDVSDKNNASLIRSMMNDADPTRGQGFSFLSWSKEEVIFVDSLLKKSGWHVDLYIDKYATETRLKSYSGLSPQVLHISTHGFYFPDPEKHPRKKNADSNPYKIADNPLIRCGLAFAGSNNIWRNIVTDKKEDDGILTAYEVSNLDLSNTRLVVLSACKTGLGDIISNEGIYGLQRSFRLAGADSMIVSLWDIWDDTTSEFMKEFYFSLAQHNDYNLKQAFSEAQNRMRNRYPDYPEKWAALILIE